MILAYLIGFLSGGIVCGGALYALTSLFHTRLELDRYKRSHEHVYGRQP